MRPIGIQSELTARSSRPHGAVLDSRVGALGAIVHTLGELG